MNESGLRALPDQSTVESHRVALAHLRGEFARIADGDEVVRSLE